MGFVKVNRGRQCTGSVFSFAMRRGQLRIAVNLCCSQLPREALRLTENSLIVTPDGMELPQPFVTPFLRVVDPETASFHSVDEGYCLRVKTQEMNGHPKLISPAGKEGPCVESPRSKKTGSQEH